jgi:hypothetical protein
METEHSRFHREEPLDPQIARLLEVLRPTPPRDLNVVAHGRSRFLTELEAPYSPSPASVVQRIFRNTSKGYTEETNMNPRQKRFAFSTLVLILVIGVLLFGGAGLTAAAAQEALPGDALYSVKTGIEQTRLSLARDAGNRAQLKMAFAERRLQEIEALVAEGRYSNIDAAAQQFEAEIYSALAELETIFAGDPSRAAQLAGQITAALSRYAQSLSAIAANVPEPVRPGLNRALQAAQIGSQLRQTDSETEFMGVVEQIGPEMWMVSGIQIGIGSATEIKGSIHIGDVVKIHLSAGPSGVRLAREIELAGLDEVQGDDDGANDNSTATNDNSVNDNAGDDNSNAANDNNANDNSANNNAGDDNSANDNVANHNDNDGANDNDDDRGRANENNANNSNDRSGANDNSGDDNGSNDNGRDDEGANDNGADNGDNNNGTDDGNGGSGNGNEDNGSNDNGDDHGNGNESSGSNDNGDDHGSNDNGDDNGGNNNGSDDDNGGNGNGDDDGSNDNNGGGDNGNGDY